jgi:hypothetical protein
MPVAAWTDTGYIRESRMRLRLNALSPADPLHDPFILALLITVAQGQLAVLQGDTGRPKNPLFVFRVRFDVLCHYLTARGYVLTNLPQSHVILTDVGDTEHLHVFSADITLAFLARFDFPTSVSPAAPPISIRHTTVPFKPSKTLYSRLVALILPEPHASHGGKRKGDADDEDVPRKKGSERGEDGVEKVAQAGQDAVPTTQQDGDDQVLTPTAPLSA